MSIEVKVPQLPESVADATLVSWHKKPGDAVARDENLVDLETDKVVLEVPAPADGVLKEIAVAERRHRDERPGARDPRGRCAAAARAAAKAAAAEARPSPRLPQPPSCRSRGGAPASPPAAQAHASKSKARSPGSVAGSRQGRPHHARATSLRSGRDSRLAQAPAAKRRCRAGCRRRLASRRAARADDAPARAHRRASGRGAVAPPRC